MTKSQMMSRSRCWPNLKKRWVQEEKLQGLERGFSWWRDPEVSLKTQNSKDPVNWNLTHQSATFMRSLKYSAPSWTLPRICSGNCRPLGQTHRSLPILDIYIRSFQAWLLLCIWVPLIGLSFPDTKNFARSLAWGKIVSNTWLLVVGPQEQHFWEDQAERI